MRNTVALGAAIAVTDYEFAVFEAVLRDTFKPEVAESNIRAARIGYDYAKEKFEGDFEYQLKED